MYVKIKTNKPVGNVRMLEPDHSNLTPCDCDPFSEQPFCKAGDKCRNQRFEKREYPPLTPYKTDGRGWGLKTLADIHKGDFIIEYVGEVIDESEYKHRIDNKHNEKDQNFYFLTIDKDRMIDAGPKGNFARTKNDDPVRDRTTEKIQSEIEPETMIQSDIEPETSIQSEIEPKTTIQSQRSNQRK
ncbi:unnamed protein product [Timema podura]|uniref:SET domain-containing protein n=1 Tax=Timema podura TaxID=61482 RepID=A0ABN7NYD2_TIMPD|nr:unnamed protein product [Timema podura]